VPLGGGGHLREARDRAGHLRHENWATAIQGSPPSYSAVRDWPVARGRFFTQSEEDSAAKVAVLGQTLVEQALVPGEDPLGAAIRVRAVPFRVVGVLAPKGQTTWGRTRTTS